MIRCIYGVQKAKRQDLEFRIVNYGEGGIMI